jgi:hypothetical protein
VEAASAHAVEATLVFLQLLERQTYASRQPLLAETEQDAPLLETGANVDVHGFRVQSHAQDHNSGAVSPQCGECLYNRLGESLAPLTTRWPQRRAIQLGETLEVTLAEADPVTGSLRFSLAEEGEERPRPRKGPGGRQRKRR